MYKQNGEKYSTKDKQKVNLSSYAFGVIDSDYEDFGSKEGKGSFMNTIFIQYFPKSKANLDETERKYREILKDKESVALLMETEISHQEELLGSPGYKGVSVEERKQYIYPKADTVRILDAIDDDSLTARAFPSFKLLLKAVLEEYARLPYYERFKLHNSSKIEAIHFAISMGQEIHITLDSGKSFQVRPYKVMFDRNQRYLYLAGYAKSADETKYSVQSFRLSRILDFGIDYKRPYALDKAETKLLSDAISSKGIQYLTSGSASFKIRLTENGYKEYRMKQHQRPVYSSMENTSDGYIMEFEDISENQIMLYFFQFGKDVEILSPARTRRKFKEGYEAAFSIYE